MHFGLDRPLNPVSISIPARQAAHHSQPTHKQAKDAAAGAAGAAAAAHRGADAATTAAGAWVHRWIEIECWKGTMMMWMMTRAFQGLSTPPRTVPAAVGPDPICGDRLPRSIDRSRSSSRIVVVPLFHTPASATPLLAHPNPSPPFPTHATAPGPRVLAPPHPQHRQRGRSGRHSAGRQREQRVGPQDFAVEGRPEPPENAAPHEALKRCVRPWLDLVYSERMD